MVKKWVITYNLLKNGVYWGYNPFTNHLLTSWDIQVVVLGKFTKKKVDSGQITIFHGNLDFPEIFRGPISLPKSYLLGEIGRVFGR